MSEYKRLSDEELIDAISRIVVQLNQRLTMQFLSITEELIQYREKFINGQLVELPCKVDDKVYYADYRRFEIVEYIVIAICINKHDIIMECRIADDSDYSIYHLKLEDVCQTQEAAEARLKELQEGKK